MPKYTGGCGCGGWCDFTWVGTAVKRHIYARVQLPFTLVVFGTAAAAAGTSLKPAYTFASSSPNVSCIINPPATRFAITFAVFDVLKFLATSYYRPPARGTREEQLSALANFHKTALVTHISSVFNFLAVVAYSTNLSTRVSFTSGRDDSVFERQSGLDMDVIGCAC